MVVKPGGESNPGMGYYFYRARDRYGSAVTGFLEAPGEDAVAGILWRRNYIVVEIRAVSPGGWTVKIARAFEKQVEKKELSIFCRQMAVMLEAGVPILQALEVVREQTGNRRLKSALLQMAENLRGGATFTEAAGAFPEIFSPVFVNMIEAGELGGGLAKVLSNLAGHYEKEHLFKEKIKSAMVYPSVVAGLVFLLLSIFISFILPSFITVFRQLQIEPPLFLDLLLRFQNYSFLFFVLSAGAVFFFFLVFRHFLRLKVMNSPLLKVFYGLPFCKDLLVKIDVARFCRVMAMLIGSGIPLLRALSAIKSNPGNVRLKDAINELIGDVQEGRGIAESLAKGGKKFPMLVVSLAAVGEETGVLDKLLEKAADFFEREVDETVNRLAVLIEPAMIIAAGFLVGMVVLSVLVPTLRFVGGIGL